MKTPLNYTGNKSRLIEDIKGKFPQNIGVFVDLFCGGGTVGLSVDSQKVILIDNNENVIELLKHLSKYKYETLLARLEKLIEMYGLSYSAKHGYAKYRAKIKNKDNNGLKELNIQGFYNMRDDYNCSDKKFSKTSLDILYLLVVYGFNNDMRFNRNGEYNLPVGKTDLNKNNLKKLKNYIERVNSIKCEFICGDFRDKNIKYILLSADFVYADPPYLLGDAVYNENGNWTEETEKELLNFLKVMHEKKINFALSNVLEKQNPKRENHILNEWIFKRKDMHIIDINSHYRNSSYNKKNRNANEKEVLITNFSL